MDPTMMLAIRRFDAVQKAKKPKNQFVKAFDFQY